MFFQSWSTLLRTVVVGILAYASLVTFLRIAGKRTLAKMNAFDFVVTVALGSTLATILISKEVTLLQGMVALALLIGLQFAITWSSVRIRWVRHFVTGEPTILLQRGSYIPDALRRTRVTEAEVEAAVRAAGLATLIDAEAVVLETDGSFSVVHKGTDRAPSSLAGIRRPAQSGGQPNQRPQS